MENIEILVYAKDQVILKKDLAWLFEGVAPEEAIAFCETVQDLAAKLSILSHDFLIALLILSNKGELDDIQAIHHLLDNVKIILLLPDTNSETIAIGHSLHPRYISFVDSSLTDVKSVLRRIMSAGKSSSTLR